MAASDPFRNYRFRVKWDDRYVAGVNRLTGLTGHGVEASGGQPQPALDIPGQSDFTPVHLERGIITDSAFENWANLMWSFPDAGLLGAEAATSDFRREMQIELYDEAGQRAMAWNIHNCWAS